MIDFISGMNAEAGYNRFAFHLQKLSVKLDEAKNSTNAGKFLYENETRDVLFDLEALARIYKSFHNQQRFEKFRIEFKLLEDQLGRIDYYDGFRKEFEQQKYFPEQILVGLKKRIDFEIKKLNELLITRSWIANDFKRMRVIKKKLSDAKWKSHEKEKKLFTNFWNDELKTLLRIYKNGSLNFNDIENGVHKIRRCFRWFSIYAQAIGGLVLLKSIEIISDDEKSLLTKELIESPFNKLPIAPEGISPIFMDKNYFYLLSWLIEYLGNLKDNGLKILLVDELTKNISGGKSLFEKIISVPRKAKSEQLDSIKQKAKSEIEKFIFEFNLLKNLAIK